MAPERHQRLSVGRVVREGVQLRHSRRCGLYRGEKCSCAPTYQAQVWSPHDRKPIRKSFDRLEEALAWRQETQVAVRRGTGRAPSKKTLEQAAEEWLAAAETGVVRTRSGDRFKPSAIRSYRQALTRRVLPNLGSRRLSALTHIEIQDLIDRCVAEDLSPSTIRNTVLPLRAIYRHAQRRDEIAVNPTARLALPAVRARREVSITPHTAALLIAALDRNDRALWASAFYAGLRRGELQALTWQAINTTDNLIHVTQSWDTRAGLIPPKSRAGTRNVPLPHVLRQHLLTHQLRNPHTKPSDYVFTNRNHRPFDPTTTQARAHTAWKTAQLPTITLHQCRHSYAAYMIAAGVNVKALSTYMGHSTITTTLDRYGHLLPGNENQAAHLLNTFLKQPPTQAVS